MFRNVNVSNLESVSQRNLRTDRAGVCFFRASEGTKFENFLLVQARKKTKQTIEQNKISNEYKHNSPKCRWAIDK